MMIRRGQDTEPGIGAARRRAGRAACLAPALAALAMAAPGDRTRELDLFAAGRAEAAAKAWIPGPGTPAAALSPAPPAGVLFAGPFDPGLDRLYWDRAAALDLRPYDRLELDLTCTRPAAIRTLGLYFKSGAGWYVWLTPLPEAGRQTLALALPEAGIEGQPDGWDAIRAVRFSLTRGLDPSAAVVMHGLRARRSALMIVQGTLSLSADGERAYARSVALRWSRWLNAQGIAHGLTDDDGVAAGRLKQADLAILPYNAFPPDRELRALEAFVKRGGILLVCYGAEPRLAELLGVRLGQYRAQRAPGQWSAFQFTAQAPRGVPEVVRQDSSNILPAYPSDPKARVIAWWRNAAGQVSSDPAWLQSPRGFWMTHVLLDDDAANKQRLLVALLGAVRPSAWQDAARTAAARAGRIGPFHRWEDADTGIARLAQGTRDEALIGGLLARARGEADAMARALEERRPADALEQERRLAATLTEAYARVQRPKPGEFRGVWDHSGFGLYPGNWTQTCRLLAEAGMTAVFPNVLWTGLAHTESRVAPRSDLAARYGDQLTQCVAAARAAGIEVHPWKVCWTLARAPASLVATLRQAGRLQRAADGREVAWLCPSHPDNVRLELDAVAEALACPGIAGIHLDYIRYPDAQSCYCAGCRRRFEQALGAPVPDWPAGAVSGAQAARYRAWRAARITDFVRAVRTAARRAGPRLKVSAAVFPDPASSIDSIGQDWGLWLREDLVDFVCPMNYTAAAGAFEAYLRPQLALPRAAGRVYPGLGVTAAESQLAPDQTILQILGARQAGAAGFVLFDLSPTLERDILPALRLGVSRP